MLRTNFLKSKIEKGEAVLGTWSVIPSSVTTDIISAAGLDFIIIDAEHGPISFETAQDMVMACESRGVSPVMRVGGIIESDILKALDIGVHCIQIPNVSCADEVREIVRLAKFPPAGERGFSPFTRAGGYSAANAKTLPSEANKNVLIAVNLESEEAILDIESILEVNELDIIFIGLYDLSKALGIPGDVTNPKITKHLEILSAKINDSGKVMGTIATSKDAMSKMMDMGLRYIVYMVDCEVIRAAYSDIKEAFDAKRNG